MASSTTTTEDDAAEVGGISNAVHRAMLKLKMELDQMRVSRVHTSELEVLTAALACLEHPMAEKAEIPAADLAEALFSCPSLGVKYVEVSCKTNHQIHLLEHVAIRSLRLLQTPEGKRLKRNKTSGGLGGGGGAGPLEMLGQSLTSLLGGVDCMARGKEGGGAQ